MKHEKQPKVQSQKQRLQPLFAKPLRPAALKKSSARASQRRETPIGPQENCACV